MWNFISPHLNTAVLSVALTLDPVRLRRFRIASPTPTTLIGIYRREHAPLLARLLREPVTVPFEVRLWALDEIAPQLADSTVGRGRGTRTELLNRLHAGSAGRVIVCDDDVSIRRGSLERLLAAGSAAGLDLFQPAHSPWSHVSHPWSRAEPFTVARWTALVEIGPLVVISEKANPLVFPLDESFEMGWGLEIIWSEVVTSKGRKSGIVDAVAIRHHGDVGRTYSRERELQRLRSLLASRGCKRLADLQLERGRWTVWQREPPWLRG